jgi:hypothetical protein
MNSSSMSRRHWIGAGLATCGYLASAQCQVLADETSLLGYTKPGPVTLRGLAPRLQHRVISTGPHGEKTYAVIFGKGDEVLSGLTELAERENIQAAQISAIGAFQHAVFAWFDDDRKAFRNIPYRPPGRGLRRAREHRLGCRSACGSPSRCGGPPYGRNPWRAHAGSLCLANPGTLSHRLGGTVSQSTR